MRNIPLKRYWDLLASYLTEQRGQFALLTILLLSAIFLQLVIPQITRGFIDAATGEGADSSLMLIAVAFIGMAIFQQVVSVAAVYYGENVAWRATNGLRAQIARHCLRLGMDFHNDTSPGELIERIDGDVSHISNFFSQLVIRIFGNMLLLAGILLVLLLEDWRMGIAFTILVVVTLYLLNKVRSIAVPFQKQFREADANLFGFLEERLAGTEDIRSSGGVPYVLRRLYELQREILRAWQKTWLMFQVVQLTAGVSLAFGYAIAFGLSYAFYQDGLVTIGTAYLVVNYTMLIARPVRELTQQVESLQNIGAAVERIDELLAIEPGIQDGPGADLPTGPLALTFKNVTFAYSRPETPDDNRQSASVAASTGSAPLPADKRATEEFVWNPPDDKRATSEFDLVQVDEPDPVLKDISFHLEPGTVMGLLGRTGSGKTTITRLIFRLWDYKHGEITLNSTNIRQPTLHQLRERVAMVTQDVQLFQATVRDNMTFFDKTISDERIMAVIDELELRDWFDHLPDGLDTRLETGGRGLSAGEAQLLAFTRVFLRDPGLVILDEASSRLDPATEQRIERAVDKLLQNRTGIIIAHRLGTVQRADDILILEDGGIREYGSRAELAADPDSRFYSLMQTGLEEVLV